MIIRPNWTKPNITKSIDLSKNVHYDKTLNDYCENVLPSIKNIGAYPTDFIVYESISDYYKVNIENLSIGFGATDVIQRLITVLDFDKLIIVYPTFEMVEVYCQIQNKKFIKVDLNDLPNHYDEKSALYIANPSGVTGKSISVTEFVDKFKYVILDEVYADFYSNDSMLINRPNNVIIVKSLSKSLGLAGLRVGFCIADCSIIEKVQEIRMSYITNTVACYLVPKVIHMTPDIVLRMQTTKHFLESNYECESSVGNYVLFKEPNKYTNIFGYKLVNGLYRMALIDLETLNEHS